MPFGALFCPAPNLGSRLNLGSIEALGKREASVCRENCRGGGGLDSVGKPRINTTQHVERERLENGEELYAQFGLTAGKSDGHSEWGP